MKKIRANFALIVGLTLIFSVLASLTVYGFLGLSVFSFPFLGQVDISDFNSDRQIVIDQPRNLIVEQDVALNRVENDLAPTIVNIYLKKTAQNALNQAYLPSEMAGQGFFLTSDGWILTTNKVIANIGKEYVAIGYQNKEFILDRFIEDEATGLIFAKAEAGNMPVANLGRSKDLTVGQSVAVMDRKNSIVLSHIRKVGYEFADRLSLIQSSEESSQRIFLDTPADDISAGAVIADLKGDVVGILNGHDAILVDDFSQIISQAFNSDKISRPILGVNYIDLAQTDGLIVWGEKGLLVYGDPLSGSPARGVVKDGDVIKKIDDVELGSHQGLFELLGGYQSGDNIDLLFDRGGQEMEATVTLR